MIKDFFKKMPAFYSDASEKEPAKKPEVPEGLWKKCNKCGAAIFTEDVIDGLYICPKCKGYFRMPAYKRIENIVDKGSFEEWDREMEIQNPLKYPGYEKKIQEIKERTGLNEAVITGMAAIHGQKAVLGVMDARFMMASMGHNVGEKITRAVERATKERLPVIMFTCSGGARMQEGIVSLMQMAKTSAAFKKHSDAGLLYITVLTDPTTGGVTASFAMLGDIILAEPNALIGFAGPRVIEQTIGQRLPAGFQRSEFLLEHGFVDAIVERKELRDTLSKILSMHVNREKSGLTLINRKDANPTLKGKKISAWERVLISRMTERPTSLDYCKLLFEDFIELHGDRNFRDDGAIVGGIAKFKGVPVTVIVQQKGRNVKDNIVRNFGMPSPEGYRKAIRLMKEAEKFHRPIICMLDTPGAFCGLEAEERGQGEAIAHNLFEMSGIKVPIVALVVGEASSGGALAMGVADEVWMLENAVYSILSPEGFASILWKDSTKAPDAAKVMKITAKDLYKLHIIDALIKEEVPASTETLPSLCLDIKERLNNFIVSYQDLTPEELIEKRYERFRNM